MSSRPSRGRANRVLPCVVAARREQLVMGSLLDQPAMVEGRDQVGGRREGELSAGAETLRPVLAVVQRFAAAICAPSNTRGTMNAMLPAFVLIHSPALGPRSWQPVAAALGAAGHQVTVPSLSGVAEGDPPFWPNVVAAVGEHLRQTVPARPVVLVPHSNAGFFVPKLTAEPAIDVRGCIFVDAALPGRSGETPVVPPGAMPFLREKATNGVLPRWTEWWGDDDVRALFPDERTRQAIVAEQPRLPLAYFEQSVPVPAHWDERPCAYIRFSPPYDNDAHRARDRGWPVEHLSGEHLHMLVEPARVARLLVALAVQAGMVPPESALT